MDKPRVSIALCTCNGARYLPAQLQSIARQTRLPDQLVICDDLSSDDTLAIIADFSRTAAFPVEVRRNALNLGSTRNFEQAISFCTGEIIVLCDQDDLWRPEKLLAMEAAFGASPAAGLVFSDARIVDENSASTGHYLWQSSGLVRGLRTQAEKGELFKVLLTDSRVTGSTMAFRASLKSLILPIPPAWVHDEWIALLASAVAPYVMIDKPLVDYRQHAAQQVGPVPFTLPEQVKPVFKRHRVRRSHYAEMTAKFQLPRERLAQERLARESLASESPARESLASESLASEGLASEGLAQESPAQRAAPGCPPRYITALQEKIDHMQALSDLPEARWRRPPIVFREVASGRYQRCSRGWITVAKDLLL